jgi:chloramphenicol-sensitive protein RarD
LKYEANKHASRQGVIALIAAAFIWGCFPLYWHLLGFTTTIDILANRIVWSFLFGVLVHRMIEGHFIPSIASVAEFGLISVAALILAFNWGISIYAVQVGRVVEGGIGMYFAPIFQIIIGIIAFGEAITKTKIIVLVLLVLSASILIIDLMSIPTIALGMGLSFAVYASIKKRISVSSWNSFVIESGVMFIPALLFMLVHGSYFFTVGLSNIPNTALLMGAGLVAAPPLILYGFGAQRVALATSGMALTLIPLINILVGWLVLNEAVTPVKWASILIIAVAVIYYTWTNVDNKFYKPKREG